jgi:hypothetical protein
MTSKIKVNILADGGDNAIITSDGAGSFTASSSLASSVQSVGGIQNTPAFIAVRGSGNVTPSANTWTNYTFDTAHVNLGSGFSTIDGYFTVPSDGAGYYYFTSQFFAAEIDDEQIAQIRHGFDIGGAGSFSSNTERTRASSVRGVGTNKAGAMPQVHTLAQLSVGDKVNTQVYVESGGIYANNQINYFIGYKLIGA